MEMNLIYQQAHRASWTGIDLDERIGMASLAAVEAEQKYDPSRGRLSTLIVTSILNRFRSEVDRGRTRMKYDGVQASCLEPSQIPAADVPDPERQTIFRDALSKLPPDAQRLVNIALHTPKEAVKARNGNVLAEIRKKLKACGWTDYRFQNAVKAVREVLR